jgi:hypothetical protein
MEHSIDSILRESRSDEDMLSPVIATTCHVPIIVAIPQQEKDLTHQKHRHVHKDVHKHTQHSTVAQLNPLLTADR